MTVTDTRRARLAELVKKFGSQAELVRQSGERQGEISALLREKSFGERKARKIESKLGLPAGWLDEKFETDSQTEKKSINWPRREPDVSDLNPDDYVVVPALVRRATGASEAVRAETTLLEQKKNSLPIPKLWLAQFGRNVQTLAFVTADSLAMQPRISCDALVLIDVTRTALHHGKVYAITFQDEVFIRRMFKSPTGGVSMRADHPDKALFPDIDLTSSQLYLMEILGEVQATLGRL